jgi:hypothetical protein
MLGLFIQWPWLALVPAALLFALWRRSDRRVAAIAALAWAIYAPYEFAMKARWLCSGECDIRVDLLLLYPLLLVLTVTAIIAAIRTPRNAP